MHISVTVSCEVAVEGIISHILWSFEIMGHYHHYVWCQNGDHCKIMKWMSSVCENDFNLKVIVHIMPLRELKWRKAAHSFLSKAQCTPQYTLSMWSAEKTHESSVCLAQTPGKLTQLQFSSSGIQVLRLQSASKRFINSPRSSGPLTGVWHKNRCLL